MRSMSERRQVQRGGISVGQIVGILLLVVAGYIGFKYLPVATHKWSVAESARKTAAKMMVEFDDRALQEAMRAEVLENTGIEIPFMSGVTMERDASNGDKTVTINYTEQVSHIWGSTHVMEMTVTERVSRGEYKLKNAQ